MASLGKRQLDLEVPEAEVELRVADVNGRLQWKRVIVGKSNGKDETVAFGGGHSSDMEGEFSPV